MAAMSDLTRLRPSVVITSLGAVAIAAVGSVMFVRSVEDDLRERLEIRAAEVAPLVASISVTGQDVSVTCSEPVLDVATLEVSLRVNGVRRVEADRSCRSSRAPIVDPALSPTTTVAAEPLTTPDGVVVATTTPSGVVSGSAATVVVGDNAGSTIGALLERQDRSASTRRTPFTLRETSSVATSSTGSEQVTETSWPVTEIDATSGATSAARISRRSRRSSSTDRTNMTDPTAAIATAPSDVITTEGRKRVRSDIAAIDRAAHDAIRRSSARSRRCAMRSDW